MMCQVWACVYTSTYVDKEVIGPPPYIMSQDGGGAAWDKN